MGNNLLIKDSAKKYFSKPVVYLLFAFALLKRKRKGWIYPSCVLCIPPRESKAGYLGVFRYG
jgi:hypothetical protein